MAQDESALLAERHCKEKDPDAFPRIYELNWRVVRKYARRLSNLWDAPRYEPKLDPGKKQKKKPITVDESRLANICSDVWFAVVQAICRKFDTTRSFRSWVLGITRFKVLAESKQFNKFKTVTGVEMVSLESDPIDTSDMNARSDSELREDVDAALLHLDPVERRAIVLKYFEKLPYDRIGEALELPAGTVRERIKKGFRELRPHLLEWNNPKPPKKKKKD